ncbi:hypothetical protein HG263_05785 [Pseudoalteromonas sp. JBTF-M23]|uniref:Uncharacterized protein n=1 Tax=Pseudoalteromonas caenipelagi TaxID=2726988 RepID=A0A849VB12_9GAMM|nr:hypothetical protein [Pseudoalteromonas caenipelagi]NOU50048.1 hypothetical protein [Pseudoalteromonas caenipelagi]
MMYLISIIVGLIAGVALATFICSHTSAARTRAFWGIIGAAGFLSGAGFLTELDETLTFLKLSENINYLVSTLSVMIVSCYIMLKSTVRRANKILKYSAGITSTILHDPPINSVYKSYIKVKDELDDEVLKERERSLNALEYRLDEKHNRLKEKEQYLSDVKEQLKLTNGDHPAITLPLGQSILIDQEFLEDIPDYFSRIIAFLDSSSMKFEFLRNEYSNSLTEDEHKYLILDSLEILASEIQNRLFSDPSVRVHFRVNDKGEYKCIASTLSSEKPSSVVSIPKNEKSMITAACEQDGFIVKSINLEYHYSTPNTKNGTWNDYMTAVFKDYFNKYGEPMLTLGVSVQSARKHKNFMYFLSHIKFHKIVSEYLDILNHEVDLREFLSSYSLGE